MFGAMHDYSQGSDTERDVYMAALGLKAIRIAASDVLANPEDVADGIYRLCEASVAGPSTARPDG